MKRNNPMVLKTTATNLEVPVLVLFTMMMV